MLDFEQDISLMSFRNVLTSSGEPKLFANIFADDIDHRKMVFILKGLRILYLSSKECLLIQMCNIAYNKYFLRWDVICIESLGSMGISIIVQ
jgi:hypothetical protein